MSQLLTKPCPQCGAVVADIAGPVHKYVPSSPGCWMTFGQVQAAEVRRLGQPQRLTVDAYMAQHPGDGSDRRERQSVFLHLVGLCAVLEAGMPAQQTNDVLRRLLREHGDFPAPRRGSGPGNVTVRHLLGARDPSEYERRARTWADAVWGAWSDHHPLIRQALAFVSGPLPP